MDDGKDIVAIDLERDAVVRLGVMDELRIEGALFFPTLGVGMEQALANDLPAARAGVGVSDLPGGAAYYAARIRHHTTTGLTAAQVHELGLRETGRITADQSCARS